MTRIILFCVHGRACVRSVMLIFAILNMFHTRQSTKNTTKKRQLPCRAREARTHSYVRTYRYRTDGFVHKKNVLFLLIDRSVCIIQNNQILDHGM